MEDLGFFGWLIILTIIGLTVAALGTIDYSNIADMTEIKASLEKPLELKNWHYALLIWIIYISGNKS
jgi:hypothetical protein